MKMNLRKILLFLTLASIFTVENVLGCSYEYIPSVYQSYRNASYVFVGKPVELKIVEGQRIYRFEVNEVFKGSGKREVEINNGDAASMCDYGFSVGESYLIYADGTDEKHLYSGNFATLNEPLIDAQDQINFLRELLKGKRESQIYGSIVRNDNTPNDLGTRITLLVNIKVKVEGKTKSFETSTDAKGIYYFNKLPEGEYTIKPILPDIYKGYYPSEDSFKVLKSGRTVTDANIYDLSQQPEIESKLEAEYYLRGKISDGSYKRFSVHWNNRISGKVLDSEGKETSAKIKLTPVSNPFQKFYENFRYDFGKYSLSGMSPGKYYLVAEIDVPFMGKDSMRYFYPQSEKPEEATVIDIKEKENFEFNLTIPVVKQILEGKIYWSDGTPIVGDIKIVLSKSEKADDKDLRENNFGVSSVDGASSFSLPVYVGAEYWLHTIVIAENYSTEQTKPLRIETKAIKIKIEKINESLKIHISKPDKSTITN